MEWMEISVEFVAAKTGIRGQNWIIFKHLQSGFCAGTKPDPNHSVVRIEPKEKHEDAALIIICSWFAGSSYSGDWVFFLYT